MVPLLFYSVEYQARAEEPIPVCACGMYFHDFLLEDLLQSLSSVQLKTIPTIMRYTNHQWNTFIIFIQIIICRLMY